MQPPNRPNLPPPPGFPEPVPPRPVTPPTPQPPAEPPAPSAPPAFQPPVPLEPPPVYAPPPPGPPAQPPAVRPMAPAAQTPPEIPPAPPRLAPPVAPSPPVAPASPVVPVAPRPVIATGQPPATAQSRRGRGPLLLGLLLLVGIGGVAAVAILRPAWLPFGLGGTGGTAQGPGEIFLEPAAAVGPDPFTPSVARQPVATTAPFSPSPTVSPVPTPSSVAPSATASAAIAVQTITGGSVGLYGGTKNNAECDMEQLVAYLEQNPDKAAAWASVHGIDPATIRQFVSTLTPVTLRLDTRVTNHGFRNGVAEARQSVLQAGTAVLVDDRGVPRARCFCGNPLLEPRPVQVSPTYTGDRWPEFAPEKVQVISPAPAPVAQLPIVDEATGDVFGRPPGTTGSADVAIVESSPSPVVPGSLEPSAAPSAPGPTALPGPGQGEPVARDPVFPSDLTALGAVQANSADPNFPIGLGVDMDATTSWFSIGPHSPSTVTEYVWAVNGPVEIGAVIVAGNAENANTSFRQGFGFSQLEIEVLLGGSVVSTATYSLDGTPDPNVLAPFGPGTVGDTVRLRLTGHESLDCGGIGELVVLAPGWEAELELLIEQGLGDLFAD